jgi:D-arabinose 1-dehydrogenase-like Zn-dependent alcohol dehydrogenase
VFNGIAASLQEPIFRTVSPVGQLALKVLACGVCRTDLRIVDGELTEPKLPLVLGHQIVGTVLELGRGVTRLPPRPAGGRSLARLDLRTMPLLP